MKNYSSKTAVEFVEVSGRLVPVDRTTPRRRWLEIAMLVAAAALLGALVPLFVRGAA